MTENSSARTDEERILTQVAREKALELEALGGTDRRAWAERVAFALAGKTGAGRITELKLEIEQLDRIIAITDRLQRQRRIARSVLAGSLVLTIVALLACNLGVALPFKIETMGSLCLAPAIGAMLYLIDMPSYVQPSIYGGHLR